MQSAYISKLMELAEIDKNLIHILSDSGTGYDELFRRYYPNQIINFGIGEQNMVAAAAGLASTGKIPFVFTAGAFLAHRAMEFIRNDVCFQNLNVNVVGMGSGLSWSSLGPTHHTTEDLSVLRCIPNLTILSPATPKQVSECVEIAYRHNGAFYIRIGMNHEQEFYGENYRMVLSQNDAIQEGEDGVLYVTGSILEEAVRAAEYLRKSGIKLKIVNVSTIKPFDAQSTLKDMEKYRVIFTLEEHNIYGGLGSILAETSAYYGAAAKIIPIGLRDTFAVSYGKLEDVRKANQLDAGSITNILREHISHE